MTDTCSIQVISENAVLITADGHYPQVFQGLSGIFLIKRLWSLIPSAVYDTEHLSKVPLGALDERRTGDIKTDLNEDIEKLNFALLIIFLNWSDLQRSGCDFYLSHDNQCTFSDDLFNTSWYYTYYHGWLLCFYGRNDAPCYEAMANFNSVIIEYINGMKLIKAYNMSRHSFQNSPVRLKKKIVSGIKYHERQVHSMRHLLLSLNVEWQLIIPIGGRLFLNGSITASIFLLFAYIGSLYLSELLPLQQLSMELAQSLNRR